MAVPYLNLDAVADRTRVLGQHFLFWEVLVWPSLSWLGRVGHHHATVCLFMHTRE